VYWSDCGGGIVRGEGSADFKKCYDLVRGVVFLISQSVWNPYETIVIGRIVIKCKLYYISCSQVFFRRISDYFWSET